MPHFSKVLTTLALAMLAASASIACGMDTPSTKTSQTGGAAATRQPRPSATPHPSPTVDPNATPSVPDDLPTPAVLMFCEPLQQAGREGPGQPVAAVTYELEVVYQAGRCQPDIDQSGQLAVRNVDGSISRLTPEYTTEYPTGYTAKAMVWTPARGELDGTPTTMTAQFLKHDAKVEYSALGAPFVVTNTTDDGKQVLASLTRRIESASNGLPVAIFLNGDPLRSGDGIILAPRVQGVITDTLVIVGLLQHDADRIVELLNNGDLR